MPSKNLFSILDETNSAAQNSKQMTMAWQKHYAAKPVPQPTQDTEVWKPDETQDEFWGANEETYWKEEGKAKKQEARFNKPQNHKPAAVPVNALAVEVIEWNQPDNLDTTLLDGIEAAYKEPKPVTYTVINPNTDKTKDQRKLFGNLHRQLGMELEKACSCGSWINISADIMNEIREHATRSMNDWDEFDMGMFEPRLRELVKMLIERRREVSLT